MTQCPVVIAILSWNRLDLLRNCLEALFRHTGYPYTVCVVDQGSTDGTKPYLASLRDRVVHLALEENIGFVRGNNLVMRRFPEHDVVLLNNDTQVQPGWLTALASGLRRGQDGDRWGQAGVPRWSPARGRRRNLSGCHGPEHRQDGRS